MVKCPSCGADNPDYVVYCGSCGSGLPRYPEGQAASSAGPARAETPAAGTAEVGKFSCRYCGKSYDASYGFCPFCGARRVQGYDQLTSETSTTDYGAYDQTSEIEIPKTASGTLVIGGVLAIIAGVLALGQGLLYIAVDTGMPSYYPTADLCLCGSLDVIFGAASIGGGYFAIKGTNFVFALIGAILGMFGFGLVVGALFGFIAVILIAISRKDFPD